EAGIRLQPEDGRVDVRTVADDRRDLREVLLIDGDGRCALVRRGGEAIRLHRLVHGELVCAAPRDRRQTGWDPFTQRWDLSRDERGPHGREGPRDRPPPAPPPS